MCRIGWCLHPHVILIAEVNGNHDNHNRDNGRVIPDCFHPTCFSTLGLRLSIHGWTSTKFDIGTPRNNVAKPSQETDTIEIFLHDAYTATKIAPLPPYEAQLLTSDTHVDDTDWTPPPFPFWWGAAGPITNSRGRLVR